MLKPARSALQLVTLISSMTALTTLCHAQDQPGASPMAAMHTGMAKLGGSMHVIAIKCGDYSREQLTEMRAQQKAGLTQSGMSADQFESVFAAGEQEAEDQWSKMSSAEQTEACEQVRSTDSSAFTTQ